MAKLVGQEIANISIKANIAISVVKVMLVKVVAEANEQHNPTESTSISAAIKHLNA